MELNLIVMVAAVALMLLWSVRAFVADVMMRASTADELVKMLAWDDSIVGSLGAPVRRAGSPTGYVGRTRDGIRTLVAIPVSGSDARGVLYVDGLRSEKAWSFASVTLHVDRRIVAAALAGMTGSLAW